MMNKGQFMFCVPNLPKPIYETLKAIGEQLGLSHQQMVILGVATTRKLSQLDKPAFDEIVERIKGINAL